jgi:AraC-like DNA-binding protein
MLDFYEAVRTNPSFDKLAIGNLLFAEYPCPVGKAKQDQWTRADFLIHALSGRKVWHTADGHWATEAGDTLFFRKGASIIEQFFEFDFCLLLFFIPDNLVKSTVRECAGSLPAPPRAGAPMPSAVRVESDVTLAAFLRSMRDYFAGRQKPSEPLLRLKLKELIVSLLTGGRNPVLAAYFQSLAGRAAPSVAEIMEANFRFNLSLEEYAALCHRSLSSFKRDFQRHFGEAPGRWLVRKRLDYAAALLRATELNVTEIAFESGFADVSHFSRAFRNRFKQPPSASRQAVAGAL